MKCYVAKLEIEALFVADDSATEVQLQEIAKKAINEEFTNSCFIEPEYEIATYMPCGWEPNCPVYNAPFGTDIMAGDALKLNPAYAAQLQILKSLFNNIESAGAKPVELPE
jgi:hypothetical protein